MKHSIINYDAISKVEPVQTPYPFFGVDNVFNRSSLEGLLKDFPSSNHGGSLPLDSVDIKGTMACLIEEIKGDQFRQLMSEKFSVDLNDKPIVITARGYSRQKDGQVHTDSKTKLITVLLYFNDGWESESGRLRMLNSNDINDYAAEFSSAIGQMIAFKVTDNCWHGYNAFDGQRQSLQINYLVEEKYTKHHVYRHKVSAWFKNLFHRKA